MKITKLRTNHQKNPIGYLMEEVVLSWVVTEALGDMAVRTRVEVARDEAFTDMVSDSGECKGIRSLGYKPDLKPEEGTRYYWRVTVWDDRGDTAVSDTAWFETAFPIREGKWIQAPFDKDVHPLFRKEISLKEKPVSARLAISGLGLYESWLNGKKISDEVLTPYNNDYNLWIQYQTYDVTELLEGGTNTLGVMLGNGWYKGRFGFVDKMDKVYGDTMKLICELRITYPDGTRDVIGSDTDWMCAPGPVLESSIYDGEVYDARREIPGWAQSGCQADCFQAAVLSEKPEAPLSPRLSVPVKVMEYVEPVELITTKVGEQVIDFGQNMTGWVEFEADEPEGTEIFLQFGEILQNGNFYNENLRTAREEFRYISNGTKTRVRPHFTFYGFRYMKVTGVSKIRLSDFRGCVIYSEMEQTGVIETSNPKINRLFLNALWGQKGNFVDTPTDCPQRDERMGWTGDAEVFSGTASLNMYTPAFYRKFLHDMKLEQDMLDGGVPHVVPDVLGQIERALGKGDGKGFHSACAWADAATVIPWNVYLAFGDRHLLREQYQNMKAWTDHIRRIDVERCGGRYLWADGFHYGDWLALDNYHKDSPFGATDNYYVASVYYYYSAGLTAKAAKALGYEADAAYYADMASKIKAAIRDEYFTKTGRLAANTQTAMILALYFDLVPDEARDRLLSDLRKKLEEDNHHLTTGFVGTVFLCPALTLCGMKEEAYTILLNEDYPSWLYEVNMGATTVWERWNSVLPDGNMSGTGMNSLNHYAYGAIVEWMYRYMCGVSPKEASPGYERFTIRPYVDGRFDWAGMTYESAKGRIVSSWKKTERGFVFHVEVPFDTQAEFSLPDNTDGFVVNGVKTEGETLYLKKGVYEIEPVAE